MEITTEGQQDAESAAHDLKELQRMRRGKDALCLNGEIHRLQGLCGKRVLPGDEYYLLEQDGHILRRTCREPDADGELACDVFPTLPAAEFEAMRRKVFQRIGMFARPFDGIFQYGMLYDEETGAIVPARHTQDNGGAYFRTPDDVYACILSTGEGNIRKYYFGKGEEG